MDELLYQEELRRSPLQWELSQGTQELVILLARAAFLGCMSSAVQYWLVVFLFADSKLHMQLALMCSLPVVLTVAFGLRFPTFHWWQRWLNVKLAGSVLIFAWHVAQISDVAMLYEYYVNGASINLVNFLPPHVQKFAAGYEHANASPAEATRLGIDALSLFNCSRQYISDHARLLNWRMSIAFIGLILIAGDCGALLLARMNLRGIRKRFSSY